MVSGYILNQWDFFVVWLILTNYLPSGFACLCTEIYKWQINGIISVLTQASDNILVCHTTAPKNDLLTVPGNPNT